MEIKVKNATELLLTIMQKRCWHDCKIETRRAAWYKTLLNRGELSSKKAEEILAILGYEKISEEQIWVKSSVSLQPDKK